MNKHESEMTKKTLLARKNLLERRAISSVPQICRNAEEDLTVSENTHDKTKVMRQFKLSKAQKIILDRPNIVAVVATIASDADQK